MKKPQKLKCNSCGKYKESTAWRENPFRAEVNNDHSKTWLCDECDENLRGDI